MIPAPVIRSLPSIFFENSRRPDSLHTKPGALITNLLVTGINKYSEIGIVSAVEMESGIQ